MGHQPHFIRGIPGKAAAYMIKNAAVRHILQRDFHHFHGIGFLRYLGIPHKKQQIVGCRELWRWPKAAPFVVKPLSKLTVGPFHQLAVRLLPIARLFLIDRFSNLIACPQQLLPVVLPEIGYPFKQIHQTITTVAAVLGEIGSREKGFLLRGHKDRQGPAAGAGHGLAHGHIHRVNVRAFLPIHFDTDEFPV